MWRFFNSITRGARTFRPSPCCSQESTDDSSCSVYNSDCQSPNFSCLVLPARCYSAVTSEKKKDNVSIRVCRISSSLCNCIVRRSHTDSKTKHDHVKIEWVWAIPCDVYPHSLARRGNQKGRQNSHFNWSHFYREQQCILNALGWGSATALAWTLCRDFRNNSFWSHTQNKKPISDSQDISICVYDSDTAHQINEDRSRGRCSEDSANFSGNSFNFNYHYPFIRSNGNHNACFQPNLFNPEVNKSFFASLFANAAHIEDNKPAGSGAHLDCEADAVGFHDDIRLQIDGDKQILEREKVSEDSGYSERVQEKSSSPESSHIECSLCSQETGSFTSEAAVAKQEKSDTSAEADESSINPFVGLTELFTNELSLGNFTQSETSASISKEKVLIEDCSSNNFLQNDRQSASEETTSESEISSSRERSSASSIDEFSDGLKEILEAGRKDLNEFNTQFMGVLEGDIGRSISKDEPNLAVAYFRAGSLLGDPSSAYNLALCYHLARGVEQDLKMARELYEAATLAGHGWATYNLAVLLMEGQGGPADSKRARELLARAEKLGVPEAQIALKQLKELQKEHHPKDMDVSSTRHQDQRQSLSSSCSEPTLSTVLSSMWSSSYSTTDLDFMDESCDHRVLDLSSNEMETTDKPKFYLE